jgi:hypothetical protein
MSLDPQTLSSERRADLLTVLQSRFEKFAQRHPDLTWAEVLARLQTQLEKLVSLAAMEATGGEPDCIGRDPATGEILYCDCSAESPAGRRNLCYDRAALEARKEFKPASSAVDEAASMGISLLTEAQYHALQQLGTFDTKTSSWLATSDRIRRLGGALFGDRRYDTVFIYHNGADSYYAARGFRGMLRI